MITVENRFNVGDEVYTIIRVPLEYDCVACTGTGAFSHNEQNVLCPKCKGSGKISDESKSINEATDALKITSFRAGFNGHAQSINYRLFGCYKDKWIKQRHEDNLYKTKSEAEAKALELNKPVGAVDIDSCEQEFIQTDEYTSDHDSPEEEAEADKMVKAFEIFMSKNAIESALFHTVIYCLTKKLRKEAGWSKRKLSEMSGVKRKTIKKIENVEISPRVDEMYDIFCALGYKLKFVPQKDKDNKLTSLEIDIQKINEEYDSKAACSSYKHDQKDKQIGLWPVENAIFLIILDDKSPVSYCNQTNGYRCHHPIAKGYLVPIEFKDDLYQKFIGKSYSGDGWDMDNAFYDEVGEVLEQLREYFFNLYAFKLDEEKKSENTEAWVYLIVERQDFDKDKFEGIIEGFPDKFNAILTWPNSD